jgi:hypothetical protein
MGFIFSAFHPAAYPGWDNCPGGYANTLSQNFLAMLPRAEAARLKRPENEKEFDARWKASALGPHNTNLCTNYDQFPKRPLQKTVKGKVAYGLDLDGDGAVSDSCAHENFRGPAGETGIDNQAYRALGCQTGWRSPDGSPSAFTYYSNQLSTGELTIVMLLRGVDSLVDDNDVQVVFAASLDTPIVDAQKRFVRGASYEVSGANPRWRNVLRGRIRDGVLTTAPQDIVVRHPIYDGESGPRAKRFGWVFGKGRLRLHFLPDGSLKGVVGGYLPLISFLARSTSSGLGTTHIVNYDCASTYLTLKALADGGRDPKTGHCTTISSAFQLEAVPAYVTDRPAVATAAAR